MRPLVRLVKDWDWPDLLRQTPNGSGKWQGIQFTVDEVEKCDFLIVLNKPRAGFSVECPPQNVWAVIQEPPNERFIHLHKGQAAYSRIYTSSEELRGPRYRQSPPALPWHIGRSYDQLINMAPPEKDRVISWVTSNKRIFRGHRNRIKFLNHIRGQIDFDLFGRGFTEVADKWDVMAPYKYSLAIENFSNDYYWSEKLSDAFLSWCMPIYYGCRGIFSYFPAESMVVIEDLSDPISVEIIRDAVKSDKWRRNLDAIYTARRLVLNKYQFFPYYSEEIEIAMSRDRSMEPGHRRVDIRGPEASHGRFLRRLWRRLRTQLR